MNLYETLKILKEHGLTVVPLHDNCYSPQYTDKTWIKDAMRTKYIDTPILNATADPLEGPELIPLDDEFCIIQDKIVTPKRNY